MLISVAPDSHGLQNEAFQVVIHTEWVHLAMKKSILIYFYDKLKAVHHITSRLKNHQGIIAEPLFKSRSP